MKKLFRRSVLALAILGSGYVSIAQTSSREVPNGWHLKDQKASGFYGISLDKAYEFLSGKKSQTVVVAVIDSGIDTLHEDLKPVLWTNPKEIPGNGIDDDGNGYVDDIHGWNFIGGRDGRNVNKDSYEAARIYHQYKSRFENLKDSSSLSKADRELYETWKRSRQEVVGDVDLNTIAQLKFIYPNFKTGDSIIRKELGKEEYKAEDLKTYKPTNPYAIGTKQMILGISQEYKDESISNIDLVQDLERQIAKGETVENAPRNYRAEIVKDNENDINDKFYGNNDLMGGDPFHGTHVSGIIGAVRNNGKGIDGIADNVRIMMVRAVPDGDEHDKDIALAIRYAVDNGAKIINMSFGKAYSPQKQWVDDAVKYAESKGVLLVHAAGNDHKNLDKDFNFPNPVFLADGKRPNNWLTIGASGDPKNGGLAAQFSNYGKNEVDIFAPGVNIYSTVPGGNKYSNASGTSMASPVTAGVAALILEYFPTLTAQQLKQVIEKSAVVPSVQSNMPGGEGKVSTTELSRTGGLLNAYEAVKLASQMVKAPKAEPVKTKMKVKNKKRA
jgi:subtilisin family serine protease